MSPSRPRTHPKPPSERILADSRQMVKRDLEIVNRLGLHARAAAKLVHTAANFDAEVHLLRDGEEVDAKSILGILMLAAAQGTRMTVRCNGADEQAALEAVTQLISNRFDEEG